MKIILKIFLALTAILLVLWLAFHLIAPSIIKNKIQEGVVNHPNDSVEIGAINLTYFPLGLTIKDSYLKLNTPLDSQLTQWELHLHHAEAGGVKWIKAWQDDVWDIKNIEISESELFGSIVKTDTNLYPGNDSAKSKKYNFLLRNIDLKNLKIDIERDSSKVELQLSLNLDSLHINRSDSLQWQLKRAVVSSNNAKMKTVITDYDLSYNNLHYDSKDAFLIINGFKMNPVLSRKEFAEKYPKRKVQPNLLFPKITLSGIQLQKINEGLFAHKLLIDSADTEVYQDLNKERPAVFKPMPSAIIAKIPFPVDIDSVQIKNSSLLYLHQGKPKGLGLAELPTDNINIDIFPFSNIGHNTSADVNIKGSLRFYREAVLSLNIKCLPEKKDHDFEVNAHFSPTSFSLFNPILYPSTGIKFQSGYCEDLKAYFYGNDYSAQGDLEISYSELKVKFPEDKGEMDLLKDIAEGIGNFALINNNNSKSDASGTITFKRDTRQPFVNYWWNCLKSGLLDVALTVKDNEK